MSKIAVVDIGSNSVRLVVFDALSRAPHYVFNEKVQCRLGEDMSQTGRLSPNGVLNAKEALRRFVYLSKAIDVSALEIVGTAALREAEDGSDFVRWITEDLGEKVRIVSGEEEAQLSAQGVMLGWPEADGLVCDIGGSSLELIPVSNGKIGHGISLPLGPLKTQMLPENSKLDWIENELLRAQKFLSKQFDSIYLVGGSWRAIAKLDMLRREYPFPILHEYEIDKTDLLTTIQAYEINNSKLLERSDISLGRQDLLPGAIGVLKMLMKVFAPQKFLVSSYGLREGVLFENMPNYMRRSDPLIVACQALEQQNARFPGFGRDLYNWLSPLYGNELPEFKRLVQAACLLLDTNWRYHPDFRAQMSFEIVAQANLCGVKHQERLFLALALAVRYENAPEHAISHPSLALLGAKDKERAIELGRALRLGAMISGAVGQLLNQTWLKVNKNGLVLQIRDDLQLIYGPSVEKRLASLGRFLGREVQVEFIKK